MLIQQKLSYLFIIILLVSAKAPADENIPDPEMQTIVTDKKDEVSFIPLELKDLIEKGIITDEDIKEAGGSMEKILDSTIDIVQITQKSASDFTDELSGCWNDEDGNCTLQVSRNDEGVPQFSYSGSVRGYLKYLNDAEKKFNKEGHSLREKGRKLYEVYKLFTDLEKLRDQVLQSLRLAAHDELKEIIGPSIKDCNVVQLETILEMDSQLKPSTIIDAPNGARIRLDEAITLLAGAEKIFCSIGIVLRDYLPTPSTSDGSSYITELMEGLESFKTNFDIPKFTKGLTFNPIAKVKSFEDAQKAYENLIELQKKPGPEQLKKLQQSLGFEIPEEYKLPELPNLPQVVDPPMLPLDVQQRKDWSGLNYGNKNKFATFANAYYELSGSETAQQAVANGKVGFYVFNQDYILGNGYMYACAVVKHAPKKETLSNKEKKRDHACEEADILGKEKIFAKYEYDLVGFDHGNEEYESPEPYVVKQQLFRYDLQKDQLTSEWIFQIGPVPVQVKAGAHGYFQLDWELSLAPTSLRGQISPSVGGTAFALAAAGNDKLVAIGVEAHLELIRVSIPLTGEAQLKFTPSRGTPYLDLDINTTLDYSSLQGSVDGVAIYPWPEVKYCKKKVFGKKVRYPCGAGIKQKTESKNLFKWSGNNGNMVIFSWGLELGPNGSKLTGDLTTAEDKIQADDIARDIDINTRRQNLADQKKHVVNKIDTFAHALQSDFDSDAERSIENDAASIRALSDGWLANGINAYMETLEQLIKVNEL